MTSTHNSSQLVTVSTLSYASQSSRGSWNEAIVPLINGIGRLVLVAKKTGITVGHQYVAVDRISLVPYNTCLKPGKSVQHHAKTNSLSWTFVSVPPFTCFESRHC
jgi:hypothetical protein